MDFEITEINRRLVNMITLGVVIEANYESAQLRVEIGELMTGWLPWITTRAGGDRSWWAPEIGEQVIVFSPNGDLTQGLVLSALFQQKNSPPAAQPHIHKTEYADGAIIEYDRQAHHLSAVLPAGGTVTIKANGGITLMGDVSIVGNLNVSESVTVSDGVTVSNDVTAGGKSLMNHRHPGDSGGSTGSPI